jgi:hypothetical protein
MSERLFKADDKKQMNAHGISLKETERQLNLFNTAKPYLKLAAPCIAGNGISVFDRDAQASFTALYEKERQKHAFIKFVPASGAASRMFKVLSAYLNGPGEIKRDRVPGTRWPVRHRQNSFRFSWKGSPNSLSFRISHRFWRIRDSPWTPC